MDPTALVAYLARTLKMTPKQAAPIASYLGYAVPLTENEARAANAPAGPGMALKRSNPSTVSENDAMASMPPGNYATSNIKPAPGDVYDWFNPGVVPQWDRPAPPPKPARGVKAYLQLPDEDPAMYKSELL